MHLVDIAEWTRLGEELRALDAGSLLSVLEVVARMIATLRDPLGVREDTGAFVPAPLLRGLH
jgi:hypothetical protein